MYKVGLKGLSDQEILRALVISAPIIQSAVKEDILIVICDLEKWVADYPTKNCNINIKVGDPVSKEDVVMQSALRGTAMSGRPPYEVYGIHFFGKASPIYNAQNKVIGGIGIGYNISEFVAVEEKIERLNQLSVKMDETVLKIVDNLKFMSKYTTSLQNLTDSMHTNSNQINSILSLIAAVADQTNIIGLNASIEAARAGEYGRVFNVVASEIRKLSQQSAVASQKISEYVNAITENIEAVVHSLEGIDSSSNEYTEIVEILKQMTSELGEISSSLKQDNVI